MQEKKGLAIVIGASGDMAFAVANVLMGIKKHSPNLADEIIIFHSNMLEKDKELLNEIIPCKLIDYKFEIKNEKMKEQAYFDRFTPLAFSRYECFNLLDEYKKVLWLDIDILIQKDFSKLCEDTKTGISFSQGYYPIWSLFTKRIECNYDLDKKFFDSGTIALQDKLQNYKEIAKWLYEKTFEYAEYLHLPDQAILNIMFQEFNLEITPLDRDKYVCHPTNEKVKDAVIVHSYSCDKFWNYYYNFKEWNNNYKKWLKMGGSKYKGPKATFIYKFIKKRYPDAPNPLRQTGKFIKFMFKDAFRAK